jgi:hypothetical protein
MAAKRAKDNVVGALGKGAIPLVAAGWAVLLAAKQVASIFGLSEAHTVRLGEALFLGGVLCGGVWIISVCVSAWRDSHQEVVAAVQEFNIALGYVQSNLSRDWAVKARAAIWPPLLTPTFSGGAANWVKRRARLLEAAESDTLAIARAAYKPHDSINQEWHLTHRLRMRLAADHLGKLCQSKNPFVRRLLCSRINREGVIMCAYLEAALAEKLAELGRAPDTISEWAVLGERCLGLTIRPDTVVPSITLPRTEDEVAFDDQMDRLNTEQQVALRGLLARTYADVGDSEINALRNVEQETDFIVRGPKSSSITRYRVNPNWSAMLTRWAAQSESDTATRSLPESGA